ncbi:MAG: hypothetical protein J7551_10375, partial [Chloroflexi bacterium]|nr:hypothetical protein [Chloroflexota bacterium]
MSRKFLFALIGVCALMLSLVAVASLQAQSPTFTVNISSTGCSINVTITANPTNFYTINVQSSSPYINSWYTASFSSTPTTYSIPLYTDFTGTATFTVRIWDGPVTILYQTVTVSNVNINCIGAPPQPSTTISDFPPSSCSGASATISGDPGSYDLYLFAFDSGWNFVASASATNVSINPFYTLSLTTDSPPVQYYQVIVYFVVPPDGVRVQVNFAQADMGLSLIHI